jgi:hypothetical protein
MSAEAAIVPLLTGFVSDRIYPDVAPAGAGLPRIVYQQVGGSAFAFTEGALPDRENARMQISCWAATRAAAIALAKQVEASLVAAPVIQVDPLGARISIIETDTTPFLYGSRQDFSVWTAR